MRQIRDTQYAIDEYGNVFNMKRGTKCTPWKENNTGYWLVRLFKDGKKTCYLVHKLVAEAYLPNPNNYPFVKHKGDDKDNNHYTNLEWGNNAQNVKEGYDNGCYQYRRRKHRIRVKHSNSSLIYYYESIREAEHFLGIDRKKISAILKGKRNPLPDIEFAYEMPND